MASVLGIGVAVIISWCGVAPRPFIVISDERRDEIIERVRNACLCGRQTYWVCTLIEESEVLQCQAAEVTAEQFRELFPDGQRSRDRCCRHYQLVWSGAPTFFF
jgi:hypothetical protein